jgi:hypothetical protein
MEFAQPVHYSTPAQDRRLVLTSPSSKADLRSTDDPETVMVTARRQRLLFFRRRLLARVNSCSCCLPVHEPPSNQGYRLSGLRFASMAAR